MAKRRDREVPEKQARMRCAVYTRKSTEDGLEQEFNSLDAQREAGEAYIRSQAGEAASLGGKGWERGTHHLGVGGFGDDLKYHLIPSPCAQARGPFWKRLDPRGVFGLAVNQSGKTGWGHLRAQMTGIRGQRTGSGEIFQQIRQQITIGVGAIPPDAGFFARISEDVGGKGCFAPGLDAGGGRRHSWIVAQVRQPIAIGIAAISECEHPRQIAILATTEVEGHGGRVTRSKAGHAEGLGNIFPGAFVGPISGLHEQGLR